MKILVTGATGYVGGRLVPRLLEEGHTVRGRAWSAKVEVNAGDLLNAATLKSAFEGTDAAYYLVHSMLAGHGFEERDRQAAKNFVENAGGLKHVIYLGGILPKTAATQHLRSRSEVGEVGTEPLSFGEMMMQYAEVRGLKRRILPVPFLVPKLAGLWVGLVTPIPNAMAVPIIEGMISPLLADRTRALKLFPEIHPIPYRKAVEVALERVLSGKIETSWSSALRAPRTPYALKDEEGVIREIRSVQVNVPPETLFREFTSLGGDRGWLAWNWSWKVRGVVDKLLGGPGLRRGRRDPHQVLPGKAGAKLVQAAFFAPRGLWGFVYWYALYPIHTLIFSALARKIAHAAEATPQ